MIRLLLLAAISLSLLVVRNVDALGKIVWSVNAGGESHTDSFGIYYARDTLKVGTASDYGKALIIQRVTPQDMILYQTERYHTATFGYDIPIKEDGAYVLVLKFCEVWFAAPNQKVFDVLVNGEHVVVSQLDIFARVGRAVAHDEIIPFEVSGGTLKINGESSVFDGTLSVEFVKTDADNPKVNAIYVMKGKADDVPKLTPMQPPKQFVQDEFEDEPAEEEPSPPEEEQMSEEDQAMLQHQKLLKRREREMRQRDEEQKENDKRRSHTSGKRAADPFENDDSFMSSTLLPIVAAIFAFIPLIVCLWRL